MSWFFLVCARIFWLEKSVVFYLFVYLFVIGGFFIFVEISWIFWISHFVYLQKKKEKRKEKKQNVNKFWSLYVHYNPKYLSFLLYYKHIGITHSLKPAYKGKVSKNLYTYTIKLTLNSCKTLGSQYPHLPLKVHVVLLLS